MFFLSVSSEWCDMHKQGNFYFGNLPRYGQPLKPIEFAPDQTMVIRLISLMRKLLKGLIS